MYSVIDTETNYIIDRFTTKEKAEHFAFLLSVQDRKDGCYKEYAYCVIDENSKILSYR